MCEFEQKVKKSLDNILKASGKTFSEDLRIGAAVSGGADSISLLLSLSELCFETGIPLYVITVNHNIRPAAESSGDADYVLELCEKLCKSGRNIVYESVELARGKVEEQAEKRGGGIEEAARFLRYEAFEAFITRKNLDILCLAHNQNDQLETLLMRFLQGSSIEGSGGIKTVRPAQNGKGGYARPLLEITRNEIESYVKDRGFTWRTDKTNYETDYLRNRIRLKLVPILDEQFPFWQRSVLSGAQKASEDSAFILSGVDKFSVNELAGKEGVSLCFADFKALPSALQRRVFLSACNKAGEAARIPNQFVMDVLSAVKNCSENEGFFKHFSSIDVFKEKNQLFVKKHSENNTDLVFSDIIEKSGTFEFPFGALDVFNYREQNGKKLVSVCVDEASFVDEVSLPFCVRNASPGDTVICADGSEKKVSDVFSDWHIAASKRALVPVIQLLDEKSQRIKAILAGFLGYKDWIVKL